MGLALAAADSGAHGIRQMTVGSVPVVLLHGLNRAARSMSAVQQALEDNGRRVVNIDYPSAGHGVVELAGWLHDALLERGITRGNRETDDSGTDFVTHSLGGIVVRAMHAQFPQVTIRRVAMLSPPNQGSEVVDKLGHWLFSRALFRAVTGPAGLQLGTAADSVPNMLGAVGFETGVVAGNVSLNPLYSWLIPGEDDGTVAVRRMRVKGMSDFITVRASHTFIMHNGDAIHQACYFLAHGRFDHAR
ncbi:MAG: triacylglycerol lipase [Gammaproteobacteria bacterium]